MSVWEMQYVDEFDDTSGSEDLVAAPIVEPSLPERPELSEEHAYAEEHAYPEPPQESIYDWVDRVRGAAPVRRSEPSPAMDLTRPVRGRSGRELAAPITPSPAAYRVDEYGVPIVEGSGLPTSAGATGQADPAPATSGWRGLLGRRRK